MAHQKIYVKQEKKKDILVIEIPMIAYRSNPWDDTFHEEMPAVIAIIENNNMNDMGFCYRIDMDYKDKPDQWTDYFFKFGGETGEFRKLCKKLKIDLIEYPKTK